jgi:hypothetical protein
MSYESEQAQKFFLQSGGIYGRALAKMRESGAAEKEYVFREYPKMLRISRGFHDVEWSTETVGKREISGVLTKELFDEIVVQSEEEEERVLSGGKTSSQLEEERLNLITRCRNSGVKFDPSWSSVRLRRELGEKMDEPDAPNRMSRLEGELAALRREADLRAEIDELRAKLTQPHQFSAPISVPADNADDLRAELASLGVVVDKRWGTQRLRDELDRATRPDAA